MQLYVRDWAGKGGVVKGKESQRLMVSEKEQPVWPLRNPSSSCRSEAPAGDWGRSEEEVLNLTWKVREGMPSRRHLSWVLKDKDECAFRIGTQFRFMPSKSDMHNLHPTCFLTCGISSILSCGKIHPYVSIHPQMYILYFVIWELELLASESL